jgi:hypothetical protein
LTFVTSTIALLFLYDAFYSSCPSFTPPRSVWSSLTLLSTSRTISRTKRVKFSCLNKNAKWFTCSFSYNQTLQKYHNRLAKPKTKKNLNVCWLPSINRNAIRLPPTKMFAFETGLERTQHVTCTPKSKETNSRTLYTRASDNHYIISFCIGWLSFFFHFCRHTLTKREALLDICQKIMIIIWLWFYISSSKVFLFVFVLVLADYRRLMVQKLWFSFVGNRSGRLCVRLITVL